MKYNASYFIKKFEAIPEDRWITGAFSDGHGHCAQGHCGVRSSEAMSKEALALNGLFSLLPTVREALTCYNGRPITIKTCLDVNFACAPWAGMVNNGNVLEYSQPTPRQRILAALYDIREETIKAERPIITETVKNEEVAHVS